MSSSSSSQGLASSMAAYNNGYYSLDHLHHHTIPVFNADMSTSLGIMDDWCYSGGGGDDGGGMVNTPPMMFSPYHSEDISTGYLQDALVEFTSRPKRRRLQLVYTDEPTSSCHNYPDKIGHWSNSNCISLGEIAGDLNWLMMMDQDNFNDRVSDQHMSSSVACDEANINILSRSSSYEMKASLESFSAMEEPLSSSCSDKSIPSASLVPITSLDKEDARNRVGIKKEDTKKRIVYPFALVKPGGVEGDITINDINERIQMPPARPVRHPVGDFACRPCVSPDGPGLSGKAVVALTKIQTQGRGTITIIRTRG